MDTRKWFYLDLEDNQFGPFSTDALKDMWKNGEGTLSPEILVWCKGMAEWLEVPQVPDLQTAAPPPPPPKQEQPPPPPPPVQAQPPPPPPPTTSSPAPPPPAVPQQPQQPQPPPPPPGGPTGAPNRASVGQRACTVQGCASNAVSRGYCVQHANSFHPSSTQPPAPSIPPQDISASPEDPNSVVTLNAYVPYTPPTGGGVVLKGDSDDVYAGRKRRRRSSVNKGNSGDALTMNANPKVTAFLQSEGSTLLFSSFVEKLQKTMQTKNRIVLVTTNSLVVLSPGAEVRRSVPLDLVGCISVSSMADSVAIVHIPSEHDLAFACGRKTDFLHVLKKAMADRGRTLHVIVSDSCDFSLRNGDICGVFFKDLGDESVELIPFAKSSNILKKWLQKDDTKDKLGSVSCSGCAYAERCSK